MEQGRSPFARAAARALRSVGGVALALLAAAAFAQSSFTGPSKCVGCHDHAFQASRWQRDEPARLKNKAHYNTRKALDGADGQAYAKKIGLADTYDLKGSCVGCHSTVFRGDASAGVSCESCHGAASGYLEPHQVKGSYAKAVAAGMRDLRGKVDAIARVCVGCHVTTDKRLAAAGHPTGAGFDAGASLDKIVHFETAYDSAQLTAAGRAVMGGRATAAAAKSVAPAPPPAPANPAAPVPPAAVPASRAPAPSRVPPPTVAAEPAEPAPWDWDQPIRPLPADYVPELVADASPAAAPEPPPGEAPMPAGEPAPAEPRAMTAPPAAPRLPPRAPLPPPSIAEEIALPMDLPGTTGGSAVSPALAPAPAPATPKPPTAARPPAVEVAELRGRAGALLEKLLRAGARVPDLPAPTKPAEFRGPDSELLRIQDEVLVLALEALRRPE